jgi:O-antigen/teichoic acid export membrane protein
MVLYAVNSAFVPKLGAYLGAGHRDGVIAAHIAMRSLSISIALCGAVVLATIGSRFYTSWTGSQLPQSIFALAGAQLIIFAVVNVNVIFYNAHARVRNIAFVFVGEAVFKLLLSLILIEWFGIAGVVAATCLATFIFSLTLLSWLNSDLHHNGKALRGRVDVAAFAAGAFAAIAIGIRSIPAFSENSLAADAMVALMLSSIVAVAIAGIYRQMPQEARGVLLQALTGLRAAHRPAA